MKINTDLNGLFDFKGDSQPCRLVTFVNPYSYYILNDEKDLISEVTDVFADGILLVYLHNIFNWNSKIKRFSFDFTSLAPIAFKFASENEFNVAIVGGSDDEVKKAVAIIKSFFPSLNITYHRSGFFDSDSDIIASYDDIVASSADILICGMGTPIQESYIVNASRHCDNLKFCFTCGGFLSQISSKPDYFNPILNKLNLRWLQRAYRHSYVRRRIFFDYPKFIIKYSLFHFSTFFRR